MCHYGWETPKVIDTDHPNGPSSAFGLYGWETPKMKANLERSIGLENWQALGSSTAVTRSSEAKEMEVKRSTVDWKAH